MDLGSRRFGDFRGYGLAAGFLAISGVGLGSSFFGDFRVRDFGSRLFGNFRVREFGSRFFGDCRVGTELASKTKPASPAFAHTQAV